MRRIIKSILTITTFAICVMTMSLIASAEKYEDFIYEVFGNGVVISAYTGNDTFVYIPDQIDGMDVIAIGSRAFYYDDDNWLSILNCENNESAFPYFILLDEANLSPLEYYWSDFISLADNDGYREMKIDLGNGFVYNIPETLRFLATINNDHTTEPLSPRVIDRSWIITLPEIKVVPKTSPYFKTKKYNIVSWPSFVSAFKNNSDDDAYDNKDIIVDIINKFESENIPISIRTKQQIDDYIKVAQEIFVQERDTNLINQTIDYAVLQKLLPHINGCKTKFIDDLITCCKRQNKSLPMSIKKLEQIRSRCGDMDYCSFF